MKLENGETLIEYEILDVLSVESCTSEFSTKDETIEFLKVTCVVQSEYGEVSEQTTYWGKDEWEMYQKQGSYFMPDAFGV